MLDPLENHRSRLSQIRIMVAQKRPISEFTSQKVDSLPTSKKRILEKLATLPRNDLIPKIVTIEEINAKIMALGDYIRNDNNGTLTPELYQNLKTDINNQILFCKGQPKKSSVLFLKDSSDEEDNDMGPDEPQPNPSPLSSVQLTGKERLARGLASRPSSNSPSPVSSESSVHSEESAKSASDAESFTGASGKKISPIGQGNYIIKRMMRLKRLLEKGNTQWDGCTFHTAMTAAQNVLKVLEEIFPRDD